MTNPKPIECANSEILRGSWPALLRAAQRARQTAIQTNTALVISRNGVIEHIQPEELMQPAQILPTPRSGDNRGAPC
jgi:hypothetical protein